MGNSQPRSSIFGDEPQRRHSTFIHKPTIDEPQRRHSIKTASKRLPRGSSGLMDKPTIDEPQRTHSIKTGSKRVPIGSSAFIHEPTIDEPQRTHSIKTGSKRVPIGSSAFIHEPTLGNKPQVIHKSVSYYSQPKAVTDYLQDLNDLGYRIINDEYSTIFTKGGRYENNALEFYRKMIRNQDKFID